MEKDTCKVVILAGGFGARLREETEFKPKPLVMIGGKPIIWHIMKFYSHYGFNDFVIPIGYKGEMIKEYFLNFLRMNNDFCIDLRNDQIEILSDEREPYTVTVVDTGINTMTGGRIKRLERFIGSNRFMATYGDGLANVDIRKLMEHHKAMGRHATITGVHPTSRFGELNLEQNVITDFMEKPQLHDSYINGGFFVFEPEVFDYIDGDSIMLEREPFARLSQEGNMAVYKHDGFWKAMDTFKDVEKLNRLWNSGGAKWKVWD